MEKKVFKWKFFGILAVVLLLAGGAMMQMTATEVHAARKNGWVTKKGIRYYYREGRKVKGEWVLDQNKWYYLKPETGAMAVKEFITTEDDPDNVYYVTKKGVRATEWKTIKKKRYFFRKKNPVGAMRRGWYKTTLNGKSVKYYLDKKTGVLYTSKMFKVGKKNYYATEDGTLKTGWQNLEGKRYYFTLTGTYTGWQQIKNKWYYFLEDGSIKTGWLTYNGNKYYLSKTKGSKGVRLTGVQTISGKTYYFDSSGVMEYEVDDSISAVAKPGEAHTLKNYLLGALQPVGHTLYVWGGGWAQPSATYIGVYPEWISWFNSKGSSYNYENYMDLSVATRAKGLDCSGFVGWTMYQIMQTRSGVGNGYAVEASTVASTYAANGYGTLRNQSKLSKKNYLGQFKAGDVGSMSGHTFIVLGQCSDGSLVIVHSTPPCVQINGTPTPSGAYNSEAVALAQQFMNRYYPSLVQKFNLSCSVGSSYIRASNMLRWNTKTLADPDGYKSKTAGQILADLFSNGSTDDPVDP